MRGEKGYIITNIKLAGTIMPVVLLMIIVFFVPARNEILTLSKDRLTLESENYAKDLNTWVCQILNELNIYKTVVDRMGLDRQETYEMIKTSSQTHEAYPYGLYLGDDKGNFFDSSDWVPEEDYVVTERNWYIEGLGHKEFAFGEPYPDAMTGEMCVSVTTLVGQEPSATVLAADVYLDHASGLVEKITEDENREALFVAGEKRTIAAASEDSLVGISLQEKELPALYRNINQLLDENRTGQSKVKGEDETYFVNINAIKNTDWYLVTCMSERGALQGMWQLEIFMVLAAIIACAILFAVTLHFSKEMSVIREKARTDPLTKLLNRGGFKETVASMLESHPDQGIMLFMDLDNFKRINDQLGHPEGDEVLKKFAGLLEEYFNRNSDVVARIGGDEFTVFVGRGMTKTEVEGMLKKFVSIFHQRFDEKYQKQELSISIGGTFVTEGMNFDALYQKADKALYSVKLDEKNGFWIE